MRLRRLSRIAVFVVGLLVAALVAPGGRAASSSGPPVSISSYTAPNLYLPIRITAGSDGAIWFASGFIGRITTSGAISSFPGGGEFITSGSDGALWFSSESGDSIGRITTGGVVSSFSDPRINHTLDITAGPDGAVWFTNWGSSTIGRITTAGAISIFSDAQISAPFGIASGSDGALWFTQANNTIGRITTSGVVSTYSLPVLGLGDYNIAAGPDGALWFANYNDDSIGRITTGGSISLYGDPSIDAPRGITAGPDGALWFTNFGNDSIGRITTSGDISNYTDPNISSPYGITSGPDGALWFTNWGEYSIGRIGLTAPYYTLLATRSRLADKKPGLPTRSTRSHLEQTLTILGRALTPVGWRPDGTPTLDINGLAAMQGLQNVLRSLRYGDPTLDNATQTDQQALIAAMRAIALGRYQAALTANPTDPSLWKSTGPTAPLWAARYDLAKAQQTPLTISAANVYLDAWQRLINQPPQ